MRKRAEQARERERVAKDVLPVCPHFSHVANQDDEGGQVWPRLSRCRGNVGGDGGNVEPAAVPRLHLQAPRALVNQSEALEVRVRADPEIAPILVFPLTQ